MASTLRRRIFGGDGPSGPSQSQQTPEKAEEVRLAPVSKIITEHNKPRSRKRRNGLIFFLGGLFGITIAGFFANQNELINLFDVGDLNMDSIVEALPAGLVKDARDLTVRHCSLILFICS